MLFMLLTLRMVVVLVAAVSGGFLFHAQTPVGSAVPDPGPAVPHIRVMSYNIHHGAGNDTCEQPVRSGAPAADCSLDLDRIARVIRDANADIVGLQEVDRFWARSGGVDQPRVLARNLGMFVCFGANLRMPADAGARQPREYGTAILSRYPLRECRNSPLPRVSDANEQRGVLFAEVTANGKPLRVMVTHLSVVAEDRVPQMQTLAREVAKSGIPTLLVGDLNARPEEASLQPLLAVLRDTWTMAGKGEDATSPAHPDRAARNRIDYILLSPGLGVRSVEVLRDETVRMASDHYPIVALISAR